MILNSKFWSKFISVCACLSSSSTSYGQNGYIMLACLDIFFQLLSSPFRVITNLLEKIKYFHVVKVIFDNLSYFVLSFQQKDFKINYFFKPSTMLTKAE